MNSDDELLVKVREAIDRELHFVPDDADIAAAAAEAIRLVREADAAKVQWYVDYANRQDKQVCDEMALANEALAWADMLRGNNGESVVDAVKLINEYDAWRKGKR